jgi:exopolyphosphatase / guanosine-5'-triphosphate,3'-diphosphate pyrophosphatase
MRLATIDLGSNTVRLLVADVESGRPGWQTVLQDQQVTRLGEGLAVSGRLASAAMARTRAAVSDYVARARAAGAARIDVVATSAVREAVNGREFAAALEESTGVVVRVIGGEEEARLTVRGVLHGLEARGRSVVFDIGGGSTEYVLAGPGGPIAAVSLRLGVVPLAERYPFPGRVDPTRYARLTDEVKAQLARELPAAIRDTRGARLVGTAGTVTTLAALDLGLEHYEAARVQGHRLSRRAVAELLGRLGALTVAERAALPCLEPGRADLIVAGVAIVAETMACLQASELIVSDHGLREGLLLEVCAPGPRFDRVPGDV